MKKYLLGLALAGTAIGGVAIAGQMGGGAMRADTDNDGAISRAEYVAQSDQRFARLDANGDGLLSGDELTGRGGRRMADADTNKDGKVSKAEFAAQAADRFSKLDVNKDGKISGDEMKAMMERMREGRGGRGMAPPPPGDAMGEPGGHRGMMARSDIDHDGRISRAEALAQAEARFAKLDSNKDGFIDKAEMDAAHDRMKQHMGKMRGQWRRDPGAPGAPPAATTP